MGAGCGLAHGGWLVLPALCCMQAAPIDACPLLHLPMPSAASAQRMPSCTYHASWTYDACCAYRVLRV